MKRIIFIWITFALLLTSCSSPQPAPTMTTTSVPTNTPIPTTTVTPVPMIEVDGIQVPDPKFTNPELFDLTNPDSPIVQFANAFGIEPEEVGDLKSKLLTNTNSEQVAVLIDKNGYPLLITIKDNDGNWIWTNATQGNLGVHAGAFIGETTTSGYYQNWADQKDIFRGVLGHFNTFVIGYDAAWYTSADSQWGVRPSETEYNFRNFDFNITYNEGKTILAQNLLESNTDFMPQWLIDIKPNSSNRERIRNIAIDHIDTVIKHAPNVKYWAVISEFNHPTHRNYWVDAMGGLEDLTWLKEFYFIAHNADPDAILYYSDFDIEFGGSKADRVFKIIKSLKEMGALIDAVAFQFHLNGKDFVLSGVREQKLQDLREEIQRYRNIGVEVIAPEMDIAMMNVSSNQNERFRIQAEIEYDLIKTLLEEEVKVISHFGGTDATNWRNEAKYGGGPDADATPFMEDGSLKPNYFSGMKALLDFISQ